ncbi:hypothetical protein Y032_0736g1941 [Ancylostoma ceylanicum]|uniref:C-type lectin domain-containing protein n=1 Tax=Ancylostoma ceylanicum TaxID=53326 RepID=A0A016WGQ1_9BILA|nr:hypothetical protein Y032_0736g1941 [Ancylostoma ceylanicum]
MCGTWPFLLIICFLFPANVTTINEHCQRRFSWWKRYLDFEYAVWCSSKTAEHGDAERRCLIYGGELASIHNDKENEFVHDLVREYTKGKGYAWIGLRKRLYTWTWSDQTPVRYDRLVDSLPNKLAYCAVVTRECKDWSGLHCHNSSVHAAVCKKKYNGGGQDEKGGKSCKT